MTVDQVEHLPVGVKRMAKRTSKKPANVARRAAASQVAANSAKPRKAAPRSQSGNTAKPALLSGGNPPSRPTSRPCRSKDTRYLDIHEDDALDEAQLAAWVKQA